MVWCCISWEGVQFVGNLFHFFHLSGVGFSCKIDDIMDGDLYVQILKGELMETINYYDFDQDQVIFQHDNDPKHTSRVAKVALTELKLNVLDWPSQSPDLNPIEHFWSHIAREMKRKTGSPAIKRRALE